MDDDAVAMDEFQEADILWPDSEDELAVPFAAVGADLPYEAAAGSVSSGAAPVLGRRFEGLFFGPPSLSASAGAYADEDDDEEWQEADVLWPDTAVELHRGGLGGSLWPFPGCSASAGRHLTKPAAAARRDGWRRKGPAASTPIDIPANVAARRRF